MELALQVDNQPMNLAMMQVGLGIRPRRNPPFWMDHLVLGRCNQQYQVNAEL